MSRPRRFLKSRRQTLLLAASAASGVLVGVLFRSEPFAANDVRAFGAKGDGKHDDTKALQRAIDQGGATLFFPAGRYRVTAPLRPRSGQSWQGQGPQASVLVADAPLNGHPFNLLHSTAETPLTAFSLQDLGFWGCRSQTMIPSKSGQEGFALYLRTAISDLSLRNCRFEHFGDGYTGGGGVLLGPRPEQAALGVFNINIQQCVFTDNGNVPGLYICTGSHPQGPCGRLHIADNHFEGAIGSTRFQNSVYILGGGPEAVIEHVTIRNNSFHYTTYVDVAVELNHCHLFTVSENTFVFQAALADSAVILVRDGCADGAISNNVIRGDGRSSTLRGILSLNFAHPARIRRLVISQNIITDIPGAISIDRGSLGVSVLGNQISGSTNQEGFGIRVIDAEEVYVADNTVNGVAKAMIVGHGTTPESRLRAVSLERNRLSHCGGGGQALISAEVPAQGVLIDGLRIHDNEVISPLADSPLLDPLLQTILEMPP